MEGYGTRRNPRKSRGIHYTPPELAAFLAGVMLRHAPSRAGRIEVLDPACGGGALLHAVCQAVPRPARARLSLVGFETDRSALRAGQGVAFRVRGRQGRSQRNGFSLS